MTDSEDTPGGGRGGLHTHTHRKKQTHTKHRDRGDDSVSEREFESMVQQLAAPSAPVTPTRPQPGKHEHTPPPVDLASKGGGGEGRDAQIGNSKGGALALQEFSSLEFESD